MATSGTINVNFSFIDSTSTTGVVSDKKAALSSGNTYTTGKVAIVTGTVGTAVQTIDLTDLPYRDASGNLVTISEVDHAGFQSNNEAYVHFVDIDVRLHSTDNFLAVSCIHNTDDTIQVFTTAGTSSYSLIMHGA